MDKNETLAFLREQQTLARAEYEAHKGTFNSDKGTEDTSDDVYGALYHKANNVWRWPKTLKANGVDLVLFLAGELLARGSYAAANGMLLRNREMPVKTSVENDED